MKGMAWTSRRGPMSIDPATRDVVQTVYIRKVELRDGNDWSVEFDKVDAVRDPGS
jgi:branched-chain amino acid transport system substrate-binding protein